MQKLFSSTRAAAGGDVSCRHSQVGPARPFASAERVPPVLARCLGVWEALEQLARRGARVRGPLTAAQAARAARPLVGWHAAGVLLVGVLLSVLGACGIEETAPHDECEADDCYSEMECCVLLRDVEYDKFAECGDTFDDDGESDCSYGGADDLKLVPVGECEECAEAIEEQACDWYIGHGRPDECEFLNYWIDFDPTD